MNKRIIYISGMHCVSCEKLLDDEFRNVLGVRNVRVDRKKDLAEIEYEDVEPDFSEIKKVANKFGYDTFEKYSAEKPKSNFSFPELGKAILVMLGLWIVFRIFQNLGFLDNLSLKNFEVNLGISFLVGLVASVSSCLVVVGAVIIAFGEKYQSEEKGFWQGAVRPNLFFHVGRLATFFILGGLLGAIGGKLNISGNVVSFFTILIAVVMAWLGLDILGILPSMASLGVRMPGMFSNRWNKLKKSEHQLMPFLMGGMTFFLPCGFTQSMQIFALTSGNFWIGGMSLFLFALGTVPSLLVLGITASWTRNKKWGVLQKVAGILILIFAIYTFQSGWALRGVKENVITTSDNSQKSANIGNAISGEQIIEMHVTASGFQPDTFKIKKGIPVKWVIWGDRVTNCTSKIIVPSFNISQTIQSGENVVRFTPKESGVIPFSCWMGMVRGKFIVE